MEAYYTKTDECYIAHLGEITFKVPFKFKIGEYMSVKITDKIMDTLISRYNNDNLEWKYNGEVVSKEMVQKLIKEKNIKSSDFDLTYKELD